MLLDKCKMSFRERIPEYIPWSTITYPAAGKVPWRSQPRLPHMSRGTAIQKQGIVLRKRDKRWQPAHCKVALLAVSRWWTMMETIWLIQTVSQLPSGKLWIRVAIFDFLHFADHLWRRKDTKVPHNSWHSQTLPGERSIRCRKAKCATKTSLKVWQTAREPCPRFPTWRKGKLSLWKEMAFYDFV